MRLSFFGAAGEVTGSCSLLETGGQKILIDCGMFQGSDFNEGKNRDPLPFDPKSLHAVIVTHAHLDHVGRLPLLVKGGFTGFFYATPATIELAELILRDAYEIMHYNNIKFGAPILYDENDVGAVMDQFKFMDYYEEKNLSLNKSHPIKVKFFDAGHIFGSVFALIESEGKKIVFSGDIGNVQVPILRETDSLPTDLDLLVCESTYGDRLHESHATRQEIIENMVLAAIGRGGVLMIPSFSLERTQELIYDLHDLIDRKHKIPKVPIFLDSPLAIGATRVYRKYPEYYDEDAIQLIKEGDNMFDFPGLVECGSKDESKKINQVPSPKIVIAGAGMMNGGRILHHALRYLSDERSTLLIIGYQAHGTLGRRILEGQSPVTVLREMIPVRCQVKAIGALSAHGDQDKLTEWIYNKGSAAKQIFLNHGEPEASAGLIKHLQTKHNLKAVAVENNQSIEI